MAMLAGQSRKYLVIALAALVLIMAGVLIYVQYSVLSNIRTEIAEEEIALTTAQARFNQLIEHFDRAPEYEARLEDARQKMPEVASEENVLRYIQHLAEELELQAMEIRFESRAEEPTFVRMPLTFTLQGNYTGLRHFLKELREGERIFRVDDIRISRLGEADGSIRIIISANAFYIRD